MTTLRMKGVRCASLEDFRKNFDFTNAKDYLRQGRLSRWVRDLGENDLADELDELKDGEYSDQTLLDNFVGIFGLEGEKACLPEPEVSLAEEEIHPPVREVTVEPGLALRNVPDKLDGLIVYLKNKIVLKIIRDIVLENLPEDGHYSIEITADSHFVDDLKFDETRLDMLAQRFNETFQVGPNCLFASAKLAIRTRAPTTRDASTVGELLDILSYDSVVYCPRTYTNHIHLLDGEF